MTLRPSRGTVVETDSGKIETFLFGESGDLVICASGNGRPAAQYNDFAERLCNTGVRVVTYNYRGIGNSIGPTTNLTLHDFGCDVWAIADHFGGPRVHLVGKAFGNRVMRTASADAPDRVTTITLIAAGGEIQPDSETRAKFRRYFDPTLSRSEWTQLHAEINYAPANAHLAAEAADLGTYPHIAASQAAASEATAATEWLRGGTAPMLVITGLDDRIAPPENGLRLATSRPRTTLVGLPNCGHSMLDEQPEAILRLLTTFLRNGAL
jgi:pimeloyl-ACP methyl ester carboxylesterase